MVIKIYIHKRDKCEKVIKVAGKQKIGSLIVFFSRCVH